MTTDLDIAVVALCEIAYLEERGTWNMYYTGIKPLLGGIDDHSATGIDISLPSITPQIKTRSLCYLLYNPTVRSRPMYVKPNSVFGVFLRRIRTAFDGASFSKISLLFEDVARYTGLSFVTSTKAHVALLCQRSSVPRHFIIIDAKFHYFYNLTL